MTSKITQKVYNMMLTNKRQNWSERLFYRLVNIPFESLKKDNPLVETMIGSSIIKIPFSHQLPFIIKYLPYYATNLVRIAKLVQDKYIDLSLIDIGANVGDSVALLRAETMFPILCIEGDPFFFSVLQENASRFSDVHLAQNYVGEVSSNIAAISIEIGGTAHLSQNESEVGAISLKPLPAIVEEHSLFKKAKMLKIDTDGFDNKIIRGSTTFLRTAKPVLFFEYDPFFLGQQNDDGLSIFTTLIQCGYSKALIYNNNGELLLTADFQNIRLWEDITHYYTGRKGVQYCDICAFHEEDNDLFSTVRQSEMQFFEQVRK